MSFNSDQRQHHQSKAEEALRANRFGEAKFHTVKAAEYSLELALKCRPPLDKLYLDDANVLMDLAETLQQRAGASKPAQPSAQKSQAGEDSASKDADGAAWQLTERPNVKLSDVVGLEDVKKALRENVIWPRQYPDLYDKFKIKPQAGVLMYGPPGNGKTYVAKAIAGELDAAFFAVDGAAIKSKWVGESERNVQRLFKAAAEHERSIIYIDECDSLLASHANEKVNVYNQFLSEIDGIASKGGLFNRFILAATNKPWLLGEAILRPGRLGDHIYVGLPDAEAREGILRHVLADKPVEGDLPFAEIAARLEGHSAVEISFACNSAALKVVTDSIASGDPKPRLSLADLNAALDALPRSVTKSQLEKFEDWAAERRRST